MLLPILLAGCGASSGDGLGAELAAFNSDAAESGSSGNSTTLENKDFAAAKKVADKVTKRANVTVDAYRIGSQDVIDVKVFKVAELSKKLRVSEAGTINFPLVGDVLASGKTAREVEQDLAARLGRKYLQDPQVSVSVVEMNSQRFTIEGAIKKPGIYPVLANMSLLQAIATAQGLTATAQSTVVLFRYEAGKRKAAKFDLDDIRSGETADPKLRSGDVIIARTSAGQEALKNILKILPMANVFMLL